MAHRTTVSLTSNKELKDITIRSCDYSATFLAPFEDATGLIPEEECQSEVDMQYSFTAEDNYGDDDTYSYTLVLKQPVASSDTKIHGGEDSGSIEAYSWSTAGITLESTGFYPITFNYIETPTSFIHKPEKLYSWHDTSNNNG